MLYLDTVDCIPIRVDKITSLDYSRHHILTKVIDTTSHVPRKPKKIEQAFRCQTARARTQAHVLDGRD
jgi:hypothetical protein